MQRLTELRILYSVIQTVLDITEFTRYRETEADWNSNARVLTEVFAGEFVEHLAAS